jgi:hypothetical protein
MRKFTDILALIVTADTTNASANVRKLGLETEATLKGIQSGPGGSAGSALFSGDAIAAGLATVGIALDAIGVIAVKTAIGGEQAQTRLETAIRNTGGATADWQPQIQAASDRMAALGFNNIEVETSIARLIPATHSVAEAIRLQGLAADLARGRGQSLEEATTSLVQVEAGRFQALTRAGILSRDQVKGFRDQEDALRALAAAYGGEASAFSKTFSGQLATLSAESKNLAQSIGQEVIPSLSGFVTGLDSLIGTVHKLEQLSSGHGLNFFSAVLDTALKSVPGVNLLASAVDAESATAKTSAAGNKQYADALKGVADATRNVIATSSLNQTDPRAKASAEALANA